MVSKLGRTIMVYDDSGFDKTIDSSMHKRVEDKQAFLAKRTFLESYLSDFVLIHCHLLSCFIITFS